MFNMKKFLTNKISDIKLWMVELDTDNQNVKKGTPS
jgi:hypothetical protein